MAITTARNKLLSHNKFVPKPNVKYAIIKSLYLNKEYERDQYQRMKLVRKDALILTFGGTDGSRQLSIIEEPLFEFWVVPDKMEYTHFKLKKRKLQRFECKYSQRLKAMANVLGLGNDFSQTYSMNWMSRKEWIQENIYNNPRLYGADGNVEDYYKLKFIEKYGNNISYINLNLSFTDIEVEVFENPDFDPSTAVNEILTIQHLDVRSKTVYLILKYTDKLDGMKWITSAGTAEKFIAKVKDNLRKELIANNSKLDAKKLDALLNDFKFKINIEVYATELEVIKRYLHIMRDTSPDFCGIWNIAFDIQYIINRIKNNYMSSIDIAKEFSPDTIPSQYNYFNYISDYERVNPKSTTHYSRYFDIILTSSFTQFYDQMSLFSNLRRRYQERNYKLDTIGEIYGKFRKVDLEKHGCNIQNVAVNNFEMFLEYAIRDVIVQYSIERETSDIHTYMSSIGTTRFTHGLKVTVLIKNTLIDYLRKMNCIISNNVTYPVHEKIPGAIIASPKNIRKKGLNIMGIMTHIYRYLVDIDITAEYPNIMIVWNILKSTTFGRLLAITNTPVDMRQLPSVISDGATFNRMLQTIETSILDIGSKYFGLPDIEELIKIIDPYIEADIRKYEKKKK